MILFTVGHSNRTFEELLSLLEAHGVARLIDVRTAPGSRRNPELRKDQLAGLLHEQGIEYRHMPELGGFRKPRPESPNMVWRNASFRGYADYMGTPEFEAGLARLIDLIDPVQTAIMCAEAVPWRCHRSLIADALVARGTPVEHIVSEKRRDPHRITPFARVEGGRVTYPAAEQQEDRGEAGETRAGD